VALADRLLVALEPVAVALGVAEAQRVRRADLREQLSRLGVVEQQRDPGPGIDAVMMAAFRADPLVAVEFAGVDDLLATFALDPQPLGHGAAPAIAADRLGLLGFLEPDHGEQLSRGGRAELAVNRRSPFAAPRATRGGRAGSAGSRRAARREEVAVRGAAVPGSGSRPRRRPDRRRPGEAGRRRGARAGAAPASAQKPVDSCPPSASRSLAVPRRMQAASYILAAA